MTPGTELTDQHIRRYAGGSAIGLPGQAISYKGGERVWLAAREAVWHRLGAAFDLAKFHDRALRLGPLGLDQLARELARPAPHEVTGAHLPTDR
jgi:uncharacterized protein (DUF885 family)